LFGLVLDPSALIPCGEKSEEVKEAIREMGRLLINLKCATLYFSSYLIKVYWTKKEELKRHHPLPPFQARFLIALSELIRITQSSRGLLCKINLIAGVKSHVLEKTRVESYDVSDVGLTEEEDREVLRIALASALRQKKVFLVSADRHFLQDLNWNKLLRKYRAECQRIEIVAPNDPNFMNFLIACSSEPSIA